MSASQPGDSPYVFPRWSNALGPAIAVVAVGGLVYAVGIVNYGFSPVATDVGYMPTQPVPYSHALHAGDLGIDCRYCHTEVEQGPFAAIPPTELCMNCHATLRTTSEKLEPVRQSYLTGEPIHWVRVHDLPDFVYFNHSAHVRRGVGCVECHGRVDRMEVVYQVQPLSMRWCLDCHRNPDAHLRPPEMVTRMDWSPDDPLAVGRQVREQLNINPSTDCSTCHR